MPRPGYFAIRPGQELPVDLAPRLNGGDPGRVGVGVDQDGGLAVDAGQCGKLALFLDPGDRGQRHLAAAGPADPLAGEFAQTAPPFRRIAHDDPYLVAAALDPLHLDAVEIRPQLPADPGRRQPCGLAGRRDPDGEMPFARRQVVREPVDARKRPDERPEFAGGLLQLFAVVVNQRIGDGRLEPEQAGLDRDFRQSRQSADSPAPQPLDFRRRRLAQRPVVQMEPDRGQMAAVALALAGARAGDVAGIADDHADRFDGRPFELFLDRLGRPYESFGDGRAGLERRADRQLEVCLDRVRPARRVVDDDHANLFGPQQGERGNEKDQAEGDRQPDMANRPGHRRRDDRIPHPVDRLAHPGLDFAQRRQAPAPLVREMRRQDEKGLDQRYGEHEQRDPEKRLDDLKAALRHEQERHECEHGGGDADKDRAGDDPGSGNRRLHGTLSPLAFRRDALADNDRIVDDDADQQEEGEQRPQVQRQARQVEEHQRADERQGNAEGYPEGEAKVEDKEQAHEHQDDADRRVADDIRENVEYRLRRIVPDADFDARRRLVGFEAFPDVGGDFEQRLLPGGFDPDENRRLAVDRRQDALVDEAVADRGDVAQRQDGAVDPGDERYVPELLADLPLAHGVEDHAAGPGAQFAECRVAGGAPDLSRHLGERQPVAAQFLLVHLDGDFAVARAAQSDLGDGRQGQQIVAQVFRRPAQRIFGRSRRRHGERHHLDRQLLQLDLRAFGVGRRKILDAFDGAADIRQDLAGIGEGFELDIQAGEALRGGADDPRDAGQADHAFLDPAVDVLLDLLRRCAGHLHGHGNRAQIDFRNVLDGQLNAGKDAADDQQDQQELGGDGIADEIGDRSVLHDCPSRWRAGCTQRPSSGRAIRTAGMPGPSPAFLPWPWPARPRQRPRRHRTARRSSRPPCGPAIWA